MIIVNVSNTGKSNPRGDSSEDFTVLYVEDGEFKREKIKGKVISMGNSEVVISIDFPLRPKQVLYWADRERDILHFAMVKWSKKTDETYTAGLSILSKNNFP
jgi:hypothetical protein